MNYYIKQIFDVKKKNWTIFWFFLEKLQIGGNNFCKSSTLYSWWFYISNQKCVPSQWGIKSEKKVQNCFWKFCETAIHIFRKILLCYSYFIFSPLCQSTIWWCTLTVLTENFTKKCESISRVSFFFKKINPKTHFNHMKICVHRSIKSIRVGWCLWHL